MSTHVIEKVNCPICNTPLNRESRLLEVEIEDPIKIGFCMRCNGMLIKIPGDQLRELDENTFKLLEDVEPTIYKQLLAIKKQLDDEAGTDSIK
jgi:hypothetical protein